jgi:hypothetical protein
MYRCLMLTGMALQMLPDCRKESWAPIIKIHLTLPNQVPTIR